MMTQDQRAEYDKTICEGIVAEANRLIAEGMTTEQAVAAIKAIWPTLAAMRERDHNRASIN